MTMRRQSEKINEKDDKSSISFLNSDERLARQVYEQGVDPYLSDKNIYHADLYSSTRIENHGCELRHWNFLFRQFEQNDTQSIADDYENYRKSEKIEGVYHFSGRPRLVNRCHIDNLRTAHKHARKTFTRYMRESGVECSMFSVHHMPIDGAGAILDIHFHAVFDRRPTKAQMEFLRKRFDDLYCQPHDDPATLMRYIRKGIARHADAFSDENLAEYCRQMTYGGPLRRFGRLGRFRDFCATMNDIRGGATRSPRLTHTRIPDGEPILCAVRLVMKNGVEKPTLIIRAKYFDESEYIKLEQRYDLSAWRSLFSVDYYATSINIESQPQPIVHSTSTCQHYSTDTRQLE